jgi:RNA polymerase sigma factor (sigma-70 family)
MSDDRGLWARACDGDGEAFGVLFDRHRSRVRVHAGRLVENITDVDDVEAAAFLELWRRRRQVRVVDNSVLPWLLVVATNVTRNLVRSRRRYRRFLGTLPPPRPALDSAEEAFVADVTGADTRVRRALRALPDIDARLMALVAVADLSVADAAEATGLTVSAAKSRLHRARARLREELGDMEFAAREVER